MRKIPRAATLSLAVATSALLGAATLPAAATASDMGNGDGPSLASHSCDVSAGTPREYFPHPSEPFHVAANGSGDCSVGVTVDWVEVHIQRWGGDPLGWQGWHVSRHYNTSSMFTSKQHDFTGCAQFRNRTYVRATDADGHEAGFRDDSPTAVICS